MYNHYCGGYIAGWLFCTTVMDYLLYALCWFIVLMWLRFPYSVGEPFAYTARIFRQEDQETELNFEGFIPKGYPNS